MTYVWYIAAVAEAAPLGIALETDTALPVGVARTLGAAFETDAALPIAVSLPAATLLACGYTGNRVTKSTDGGVTWSTQSAPPWANGQVCSGAGRWVFVGDDGSDYYIWSSEDGSTWTQRQALSGLPGSRAVWTGSEFWVALFNMSSNGLYKSTDGITWTAVSGTGVMPQGHSVFHWSGSFFLAATNYTGLGAQIFKSTDGVAWTEQYYDGTFTDRKVNCFVTGGGITAALFNNNSPYIMTSTDGETWTTRTAPGTGGGYGSGAAYDGSIFVAPRGAVWNKSSDGGVTWVEESDVSGFWWDAVWTGSLFVLCGDSTNYIATSPDGTTWTARTVANIGATTIAVLTA